MEIVSSVSQGQSARPQVAIRGINVVQMASTLESVFSSQVEAFFLTEIKAANDALQAGLTDAEIAASASANRKLAFAGLNAGLAKVTAGK